MPKETSKWNWSESRSLCLTRWDPKDYIVDGILLARKPEWVAFPFSSGSSWPRNLTGVSCIAGGFFTNWAIRETDLTMLLFFIPKLSIKNSSLQLTLPQKTSLKWKTTIQNAVVDLDKFTTLGRWADLSLIPHVCVHAKLLQSCLTLCDPMDCSLPGSSVHGILQARVLEGVAMPSSRRIPSEPPGKSRCTYSKENKTRIKLSI